MYRRKPEPLTGNGHRKAVAASRSSPLKLTLQVLSGAPPSAAARRGAIAAPLCPTSSCGPSPHERAFSEHPKAAVDVTDQKLANPPRASVRLLALKPDDQRINLPGN